MGGKREGVRSSPLPFVLAEAARSECAPSTRAMKGSWATPHQRETSKLGRINLNMHGSCSIRAVKANLGRPLTEGGECLPSPVVESRTTNRRAELPCAWTWFWDAVLFSQAQMGFQPSRGPALNPWQAFECSVIRPDSVMVFSKG